MGRRRPDGDWRHLVGVDLRAQGVHVLRHVAFEVVEVPEAPDEVDVDDLEVGAVAVQVVQRRGSHRHRRVAETSGCQVPVLISQSVDSHGLSTREDQ